MAIALIMRSRFSERRASLINGKLKGLIDRSTKELQSQGFTEEQLIYEVFANIRFEGSDTAEHSTSPFERPVYIDDVRIGTITSASRIAEKSPLQQFKDAKLREASASTKQTQVFFDSGTGCRSAPVYKLKDLGSNVRAVQSCHYHGRDSDHSGQSFMRRCTS
ncbi:hypothetical protein COCHEDRAFT_1219337 [Bipolaris maydis C5]|uniref:Uncharacterized protein n=2 Tax=Cochliobolus heterostrophus TaxID=5016 RepID=M2TUK1_COCH5|nr:hypothetical protein COCHEDRAFT_1219337 [Bipolaris maydis C5]KAJ5024636.1 hypothetical protein J3E73DRAFT_371367 [Bipolaris maydis]KAJ6212327.1 hypothetical protein PSV09DRAFT_1219337 [Bipolaris maydis]KAJ6266363.1 hypothetical protein PSV08DRAFT_356640 [Bipolaris maydis]